MSDPTILLIDDDDNILTVLSMRLRAAGWQVVEARDGDEALRALGEHAVDVALSDLRLEGEDGLEVMDRLHAVDSGLPVLILTAHGSIPNAVEALHRGAIGYLTKPVDKDELLAQLGRALQARRLAREVDALRRAIESRGELMGLVGVSPAMRRVFELLEQLAPGRVPVTLVGETGTGRETCARALHRLGPRANRPFLAVDCGLRPERALWELLFGGPDASGGKVAAAHGGTLYLSRLEELPLPFQGSLVALLRQAETSPGATLTPGRIDLRVVVALSQDPGALAAAGVLREELAARLGAALVHLPALRERPEDIPVLARHILQASAAREGVAPPTLSPEAEALLRRQPWRGNADELALVLAAAARSAQGGAIRPEHLGA